MPRPENLRNDRNTDLSFRNLCVLLVTWLLYMIISPILFSITSNPILTCVYGVLIMGLMVAMQIFFQSSWFGELTTFICGSFLLIMGCGLTWAILALLLEDEPQEKLLEMCIILGFASGVLTLFGSFMVMHCVVLWIFGPLPVPNDPATESI